MFLSSRRDVVWRDFKRRFFEAKENGNRTNNPNPFNKKPSLFIPP